MVTLALGKARSCREPNLVTDLGDAMFCQKSLHKSWRLVRRIVVMKLLFTTCVQLQPFSSYCIPRLAKDFEVVFRCSVISPLTGCQVTSRPRDRFSRYSKWLDTFQTDLVVLQSFVCYNRAIAPYHPLFSYTWQCPLLYHVQCWAQFDMLVYYVYVGFL
jgi:hypothetical protein